MLSNWLRLVIYRRQERGQKGAGGQRGVRRTIRRAEGRRRTIIRVEWWQEDYNEGRRVAGELSGGQKGGRRTIRGAEG